MRQEGLSTSDGCPGSADKVGASGQEGTVVHVSPNKSESDLGQESDGLVGSTVADALYAPVQSNVFRVSDIASNTSVNFPDVTPRVAQLSGSSRALIKVYFEEATPVRLSPGHAKIALNESQVSSLLMAVADEAVKSSPKALEGLIQQAKRLSLGTQHSSTGIPPKTERSVTRVSDDVSQTGASSGHASDTSGTLRSDDEFASIGYVYEHSDAENQRFTLPPTGPSGSRPIDLESSKVPTQLDSPGQRTLAGLKAKAVAEKAKSSCRKKQRKKPTQASGESRHRVPRVSKVIKEADFKGMEWTKTFVSGAVDHRWNPYKFYCQICKGNF